MSRRALVALVLTCFLAGVVLMIGFETPLTRAVGVACLLAFVAGGLFLIVDPVLLSGERDTEPLTASPTVLFPRAHATNRKDPDADARDRSP